MAQSELEQGTSSGDQTKAERIKKKGEFAKVALNSPLDTRHQTIERERQHKENEIAKTLYGYYGNGTGDLPFTDTVNLLRATIKHVKQNLIEAFYKTANGRFIIVLNNEEHRGIYSQELNFREPIQNENLNLRILPKPYSNRGQARQGIKGTKYDPYSIRYYVPPHHYV